MKQNLFRSAAFILIFMAALLPTTAMAAQFRAERSGSTSVGEAVNDDLYVAGNSVAVNAPVSGDVVLAGGTGSISGTVGKSILAAGGTLNVVGDVSDDIRLVGGNIFVNGKVGHDVVVLAGQTNISSTANIGGDLVVLGGTVTIDAPVAGNVYVRAGEVTINSAIGGSVKAAAAQTLTFGPQASIAGLLAYSSPTRAQIADGVARGGIQYDKTPANNFRGGRDLFNALFAVGLIFKIISLFALALLLALVFKRRTHEFVQTSFTRFGWDILHGFSALVIVPFAAIILLVTFIGAPLAILAFAAYAILLVLAGILAPILVGAWLWKLFKKTSDFPVDPYTVALGVLAYVFAGLIPLLGWAFDLAFMLAALGVLSRMVIAAVESAQGNTRHAK